MLKAIILGILLTTGCAWAEVTASLSNTAPANAYLENSPQGNSNSIQWKYTNEGSDKRHVGQSFQITESILFSGITFQVKQNRAGSYEAEFRLSLYATDPSTNLPVGSAFYEETGFLPNQAYTDGQYLSFMLSEAVVLAPGQYGVLLSFESPRSQRDVNFYTASASSYPAGRGFTYELIDGTFSYRALGGNLNFFVHATAIPEPSVLPWLLMGGVLVRFCRRAA